MKKMIILFLCSCLFSYSQQDTTLVDALHLREVPKHNLAIDLGIAQPLGDYGQFAGSGLSIGVVYDLYTNKNWGYSVSLRHQGNQNLIDKGNPPVYINAQDYAHTSIAAGGVYSYTKNRFQLDVSSRLGLQFLNRPDSGDFNGPAIIDFQSTLLNGSASKNTALYAEIGLRFNYYFRRSVQVYASPLFTSTVGNPYQYDSNTGSAQVNPQNIIFNVGVKIAIGKQYSNGELRDDTF